MTSLAPYIRMVQIPVSNLDEAVDYYCRKLSLSILERTDNHLSLTIDQKHEILRVVKASGGKSIGHFALLLPKRSNMGCFLRHVIHQQIPIIGAIDHRFCESIYLSDPDRNNIEIACDRHKNEWFDGSETLQTGDTEFDYEGVYYACDQNNGHYLLPEETRIGHIMINVQDMEQTKNFYENVIGLKPTYEDLNGKVYMSFGDYHHLIGLNPFPVVSTLPEAGSISAFTLAYNDCVMLKSTLDRCIAHKQDCRETSTGYTVHDPEGNTIYLSLES